MSDPLMDKIRDIALAHGRAVAAMHEGHAGVDTKTGPSTTEYTIAGDLPQVFAEIERIFDSWHPAGYGTRVASIRYERIHYVATMTRSNSCE